jgi:hypothetical protein
MVCSGDLMPSTNPCPPMSTHVFPCPPIATHVARPPPPMLHPPPAATHVAPAWALHGGTPDAEACKGAKGLGADGWRSACGMPILPDSSPCAQDVDQSCTQDVDKHCTQDVDKYIQHTRHAKPRPPSRPGAPTAASCLPSHAPRDRPTAQICLSARVSLCFLGRRVRLQPDQCNCGLSRLGHRCAARTRLWNGTCDAGNPPLETRRGKREQTYHLQGCWPCAVLCRHITPWTTRPS